MNQLTTVLSAFGIANPTHLVAVEMLVRNVIQQNPQYTVQDIEGALTSFIQDATQRTQCAGVLMAHLRAAPVTGATGAQPVNVMSPPQVIVLQPPAPAPAPQLQPIFIPQQPAPAPAAPIFVFPPTQPVQPARKAGRAAAYSDAALGGASAGGSLKYEGDELDDLVKVFNAGTGEAGKVRNTRIWTFVAVFVSVVVGLLIFLWAMNHWWSPTAAASVAPLPAPAPVINVLPATPPAPAINVFPATVSPIFNVPPAPAAHVTVRSVLTPAPVAPAPVAPVLAPAPAPVASAQWLVSFQGNSWLTVANKATATAVACGRTTVVGQGGRMPTLSICEAPCISGVYEQAVCP